VFHAIAVETLTNVFGVPKENALTYAFAQHAVIYFVPASLGAMFLWHRRAMWRDFAASIGLGRRPPVKAAPSDQAEAEPVAVEAGSR
jgi:hypothetical protein